VLRPQFALSALLIGLLLAGLFGASAPGAHADRIAAKRAQAQGVLAQLQQLDDRAHQMRVPLGVASVLYTLREHIALIYARIARATPASTGSRPPNEQGPPLAP